MPEEAVVETTDPFAGQEEISLSDYEKSRQPAKEPEPPAAEKSAETVEGKEPSETEQEKKAQERDEKGKFAKKVEFSPEQQEILNREIAKAKRQARREVEAAPRSVPQATAAEEEPEDAAEPVRPEPPKLSSYTGTVAEYEKELEEYPAKLAAYLDAQHEFENRVTTIQGKLLDSEKKALKEFPDYKEEFDALAEDIKNDEEPALPPHVLKAIAEDTEDPHGLSYYLAKNRTEFRRLATLGPNEALREVLKLEFKIQAAKDAPAPAKEQPRKPKPPEPVGARATSSAFDPHDEKLDADEWAKQRNAQLAKRR